MKGMDLPRTDGPSPVASLKVLTVNIHKGFSFLNRRFMLPELRDAVHSTGTDLVFLQEVLGDHSHHAQRFENWPQQPHHEFLADSMWSEFAYGRNAVYPEGEHGNALLSKYPIRSHENLDVSQQGDEQRGLLHSVLAVPGRDVHAICVHLGLREAHRRQQLQLLCALLAGLPTEATVIVAGDFNDWRRRADALLAEQGLHEAFVRQHGSPARSFPARWPLLCLDRIYVRNGRTCNPQVLSSRPWSHLSDHVPLAVEVWL
ncbi:endonuclease/exonuclease/phosphatase family protein [Pseudomonas sp. L5B5]|uniref:endonuclease/exonuclease/phosphatase family protein n=1 Tax=Pseudomonas sp. L5B5 TaxID=2883205 RepID=UPI001CF9C7A4|nr:endonuclease/exonuclease/phosphatase family protein [Pseudomonas sp. L5B5]UCZ85466.1 endonuclease/exonuclease/phosphatase family protein [Pseudomonas sp. L5B5]